MGQQKFREYKFRENNFQRQIKTKTKLKADRFVKIQESRLHKFEKFSNRHLRVSKVQEFRLFLISEK